jgi:hypothetical protein
MRKLITIASINFKDSPVTRQQLNDEAVLDYSAAYKREDTLPPPLLYQTDLHGLLVADGAHRITALQHIGVKQTLCEVRQGTRADCFNASVGSNLHHGVRRTNADKRQSIATAIAIYPEIADLKIAELCHVSHSTVAEVRKSLETSGTINERKTIKTSDGKSRPTTVSKPSRRPKMQIRQSGAVGGEFKISTMEPSGDLETVVLRVRAKGESPPDTQVIVDSTGYPIPEKAQPIWNRRFEIADLIQELGNIRHTLQGFAAAKDIIMAEVNLNAADCELEALISRCKAALPYAVCPSCQGKLVERCTNCSKRGMVSRTRFERTDPALLKVRSLNARPARLPK